MTVKQLMEKTGVSVYIVDGKEKFIVTSWNILFDTFGDCLIDEIQPGIDGNSLEITLKKQLVRKEG